MARLAREISKNGLYHIVFRGVNHQNIFEEATDYQKLKDILIELKNQMGYEIYAYCFMSNHVHILLKENNPGDISLIMKRLLTKYARWYNLKYKRSGALIANRYKSKPIDIDEYFLSVIRYIHQNPLKANMVNDISKYKWSSYNEYVKDIVDLIDKDFVLEMLPKKEFIEFHQTEEQLSFEVTDRTRISDHEIQINILKDIGMEPLSIANLEKVKRDEILHLLKKKYSLRQLERVTGISRGVIHKS